MALLLLRSRASTQIVVGGGVVGVTSAYLLAHMGRRVAVFESNEVGGGTSGLSTAKVTTNHNLLHSRIYGKHGEQGVSAYAQMNIEGFNTLRQIIKETSLADKVQWESGRTHTTYTTQDAMVDAVRKEYDLCKGVYPGVSFSQAQGDGLAYTLPSTIPVKAALTFADQAQFNAYAYCLELCKLGLFDVYENTRVVDISESSPHLVKTIDGLVGSMRETVVLVLATQCPIMDRSLPTTLWPHAALAFSLHCRSPRRSDAHDPRDVHFLRSPHSLVAHSIWRSSPRRCG